MWRYTSITAFFVASYAIWTQVKQEHDMWEAAAQIVQKAEKRGCESEIRSDGSIAISIDGILIDIIPENIQQV